MIRNLVDTGAMPPVEERSLKGTLEISRFRKLPLEEKKAHTGAVVVDGAKWVATDKNGNTYSCNGTYVGKHIRGRKFSVMELGQEGMLHTVQYYDDLYVDKEMKTNMSNLDAMKELDSLYDELEGKGQPMEAFTNTDPAKEPAAEKAEGKPSLSTAVTAVVEQTSLAATNSLHDFNQILSKVLGYVTATEDKIDFVTAKRVVTRDGKKVLRKDVSDEVRAQYEATGKVPASEFETYRALEVKNTKPGKIQAVIFDMPFGGIVPLDAFSEAAKVTPDRDKKDLKRMMVSREEFYNFMTFYFGDVIKEDPATHGAEAGELKQSYQVNFKKVNGSLTNQQVMKRVWKSSKRNSLLLPTNYLPIKTYKTVTVSGALSEDDIKTLNKSAFGNMVRSRVSKNGAMESTYSNLSAEDRAKITVDPTSGAISSTFFAANVNERESIIVNPFWAPKGDQPLAEIRIPVKEEKHNEKTGKTTIRAVTYSAVDQRVEDPSYVAMTSLKSPKFAKFIEVVGEDVLNPATLRGLVTKSGGSKGKGKKVISNREAMAITLAVSNNTLKDEVISLYDSKDSAFEDAERSINKILLSAK